MAVGPMMLAAAAIAPGEAPLWEMVPPVDYYAPCPLPEAEWGKTKSSDVEGWRIISVIFEKGKLSWDGAPIDEQALRSRASAVPALKSKPQIYFYSTGDCAEARRLAALIASEAKCTPRICFASEWPIRTVRVAPPAPPAPSALPPRPSITNYPPAPPPPASMGGKRVSPRGQPQTWVINDDYPPAALRAREQGTTGFRLDIDATGRVTDCTVTSSSGSPLLDETTCTLLKRRALFNPAEDAQGAKIAASWTSRFRWELPITLSSPISWAHMQQLTLAEDGAISDCKEADFGTPAVYKEDNCARIDNVPRGMRMAMRGNVKGPVTVMFRYQHNVVGMPPMSLPKVPAGFRMVAESRLSFDVDAAGKIGKCTVEHTPSGLAREPTECDQLDPYVPGPRPIQVTVTQSMWTTGDPNLLPARGVEASKP